MVVNRIRAARLALGIGQDELAKWSGVSARTIHSAENNKGTLQYRNKARLTRALLEKEEGDIVSLDEVQHFFPGTRDPAAVREEKRLHKNALTRERWHQVEKFKRGQSVPPRP